MAEITQEQVEEVFDALPEISPRTRAYIAAKFAKLYGPSLATPELVALGEAAVRHDAACKRYDELDELEDTSPEHDARQDELDRSTAEVLEAARLYAQSIKGEDHGK